MNNVNMGGMNAMSGPMTAGPMPTMSNGTATGPRQAMPGNDNRSQLNTYIYEYFLKNEMYDCARSLLRSEQPMSLVKESPGRRRDGDGGEEGENIDSKDDIDSKRPEDLPAPNLPRDTPESCFLYEWWCLFWDMFNATRGKAEGRNVLQYVEHTQTQSRARAVAQQKMMGNVQGFNGMMMNKAMPNGAPQDLRQRMMNRQMPQNMQMVQNKQQQMQRDPSSQDGQARTQSPNSAENAPSPSKRPRTDGANFNPQQMPNGRAQGQGMPQQVGDSGPNNVQAAHIQLANGIDPNNLTGQQFQGNASAQARLAGYQANLAQQQQSQMPGAKGPMPNPGPQSQGSPMMGGADNSIANYYNPVDQNRTVIAGAPGAPGGNHALQDYQMQLMLLEQQNKKRLMMARQEQDNMSGPRSGENPGAPGGAQMPNGQQFQGTSPQGGRSVNSPNPNEQMKRANPQMAGGMPSPLPDAQNRGSPGGGMNFNMPGGPMDPNMNQQYAFAKMGAMDPNMVGMQNGMRPPSSHPGQGFPGQNMTPQQVVMARGMAQQQPGQPGWQGPNGQMGQPPQGTPQQQNMGTPQQRAMPPPSAPQAGGAVNGRTPSSPQQGAAPPTPQQGNKAIAKGKKADPKDTKAKRATKKGSAPNLNAGATPSADTDAAGATPTPQTPITPHNPGFNNKGQNGAVQMPTNGQPPAQPQIGLVPEPPFFTDNFGGMESFPGSLPPFGANPDGDVLQDFDFDSFLHQDGEMGGEAFNFDAVEFDIVGTD